MTGAALTVTLTFAMISGLVYALVNYSPSTVQDDQSFKTHLPTEVEKKRASIEFTAPQPGRHFSRLDLDAKAGTKALEDRVWNYVMNDKEFRKYFAVNQVACSETGCVLTVSLKSSVWEDLQSYVKARPDFVSASIVFTGGQMMYQVQTRKFNEGLY